MDPAVGRPEADPRKVAAVRRVLARTDPFALPARIDAQLEQVWACANRVARQPLAAVPKVSKSRRVTPWRGWTFSAKLQKATQPQRRAIADAR